MKPCSIEKLVREKLGEMFGTKFRKSKLITGYDSKKRPQLHEFDLISENMDIIGEIKSGKCTRTNYNLALVDCFYLSKIKATTKLMVFTDKELYEYFKDNSEGVISKDICAILVLPYTDLKPISLENQVNLQEMQKSYG
jgi:ABC-type microcin C transport system duplicated ATPase subunit YejF